MPNSFLWIGLVVVWLFVLVPMLVNNRPRIRQTSDAALATRVLHRGDERPVQRGPAAGHRSDPYWQPEPDHYGYDAEDLVDTHAEEDEFDGERAPVGEYVPARRGRGGFDPEADAIAREARYTFRQRSVLGLAFATIMSAALGLIISPLMWWAFAAGVVGLLGYLAYLRRQVQIEQEIRRRRTARLNRSRLGVESRSDEELRLIPARLRRPGAVVLEVDDEDPEFDHLEHFDDAPMQQATMRRAAGE
ncbi:hypothetical protein FND50_10520 [Rhodococcus sp. WB9]|uniref:divisome protein SepX/GlpR n=1 Tax=Rhodococcus sp. WB9 TaxID=2594007 RepID=UPI0011859014|nr:gephyrin-like molybdotransferase receptor GlpR [Rhodococcus sp. WB9]QDQ91199.1 hypothetical protein FND50_10520 [Rhodococcus sp. WB9]